jgi:hypothetical protein
VWLEPTTYLTRSDQTNHYTPDAVYFFNFLFLALNNNYSLAQIHIYFICIVLGVHNTEAYYVETIPVVQEQPYDQYDIAYDVKNTNVIGLWLYPIVVRNQLHI